MSAYDLDLLEDEDERPFNRAHFKRMLGYVKPYSKLVTLASLVTLFGVVVNLAEPLLFRFAIDEGIAKDEPKALVAVLGILFAMRLSHKYTSRVQIRTTNRLGQGVLYDIRQELFERVQSLPFSFFDHRPVGKIISRITNDVNHIGNLAASVIINVISQMISLLGIISIMVFLHWRMALLSFTTLPFLVLVLTKLRWALESAWRDTRKAVADINAHLNETVQGLQVIQAFGRESHNSEKFRKANRRYYNAHMKAMAYDQAFWPLADIVGALGTVVVIWYGAREYMGGTLTLGLMVAFVDYLAKFWRPISTFSRVWSQILSAMASSERVFGIMDQDSEDDESAKARQEILAAEGKMTDAAEDLMEAPRLPRLTGQVEFENVSFCYRPDEPVLHDVSFTVEAGETIALVGPTGAGKTTIINLLSRFYTATSGRVLVDGHDIAAVDLPSYRSQLGIVLQDTFIFSGTVMENLLFGKLDATPEEVNAAALASGAKSFIDEMEKGYDSEIKERGSNLSTGQRQLLAFARALLAQPRILILDEATSSIDPETERLIQEAMKALLQGRTAFIIAHRLSTVRAADRIMVVDGGRIVEQGAHEDLAKTGGIYAKLYEAQFRADDIA